MSGRAAILTALAALLAAPAAAQPWRFEKDGAVHYTDDLDALPPKLKAKILAAREAEAREEARRLDPTGAPPPAQTAPPTPEAAEGVRPAQPREGRTPGRPAREAGTPLPRSATPEPAEPPPPPKAETAAERRARLQAALAEARAALAAARQTALLVPDGRHYAARSAAEARVAALEAELAALGR